jgi:hypothetical protein
MKRFMNGVVWRVLLLYRQVQAFQQVQQSRVIFSPSKTTTAAAFRRDVAPFPLSTFHGCKKQQHSLFGVADALATEAYDWCINLGAPAALVAGAVIATIYEQNNSNKLAIRKNDQKWVQFAKKMSRLLLLSAFVLEIISIFVTTVTGTALLSYADRSDAVSLVVSKSSMGFLRYDVFSARSQYENILGGLEIYHLYAHMKTLSHTSKISLSFVQLSSFILMKGKV